MTKGYIIAIVVVVVLVGGGLIYWYSPMQTQSPSSIPVPTGKVLVPPEVTGVASTSAAATVTTVTYTDNGFSPATVTVPKGSTVVFKNTGSIGVWVASDPHPLHNGYPTTGGCIGSTFDSCKSIPPGGSWPFTFTFVGSWGYHNHLSPGQRGTVVVQ